MTQHDLGIDIKWCYLFRNDAFAIPCIASLCEVIHCCKFYECRKHKGIAHCYKPIHSCGIGHLGERIPCADAQSSHGQHSCHSCNANSFSVFGQRLYFVLYFSNVSSDGIALSSPLILTNFPTQVQLLIEDIRFQLLRKLQDLQDIFYTFILWHCCSTIIGSELEWKQYF